MHIETTFHFLALYFDDGGNLKTTRIVETTKAVNDDGTVAMQRDSEVQAIKPTFPRVAEAIGAATVAAVNRAQELEAITHSQADELARLQADNAALSKALADLQANSGQVLA